ncbi:MAG: alpha-amylase family glycosyl hydrolase [Burkholderiales bacterium]
MGIYAWWQRGIIYQVYPRSFQDSNGDGIGDLPGITHRLDYLRWLGIDALWISPIYPSPMKDFGYDVLDYCGIDPAFGTLQDFEQMVYEAHGRGLKVIFDFVPNHTSDQHPWFLESRSSKDNPKRDWYIWRDPAPDGAPPNNWLSNFGGSGWQFDEKTGQYYYHAFLPEQPDLNWRNPEVVQAMLAVLRFWLDRGVDGFRVDVIWHLIKDAEFRNNPRNPTWTPDGNPYHELLPIYTSDRPEVHDIITQMRRLFDEYEERVLIGEIYLPVERLVQYYGRDMSGAHLPFNFQLLLAPWDARHIEQLIQEYETQLPAEGWPNWVLGNHDNHRIASRVGPAQARIAAMLLLTLRGTPTLYYGDEIGMCDVDIPHDRVQDPFEKNVPGKGLGRDPERTPMQWHAGRAAGFSTGEPWLPIAHDYVKVNVHEQRESPDSILVLYRRLIVLRRGEPALEVGRFEPCPAAQDVLAYFRYGREGEASFLIVLNLGSRPQVLAGSRRTEGACVAVGTHHAREGERIHGDVLLGPNDGVVLRLAENARDNRKPAVLT